MKQDIEPTHLAYRLLKIQNRLSFELGKAMPLNDALMFCVESALEATDMELGGIYLVNKLGGLEMIADKGLPADFADAVRYFSADTPRVTKLMEGKPLYFGAGMMPLPVAFDNSSEIYKTLAVIPFMNKGKVIGCLNIGSNKTDTISDVDIQTLETIGNLIGDLIARIRTEEHLKSSEEKYRALVETTYTGYLILDESGCVVDANSEYVRMAGAHSLDEITGRSVLEWTAPHDRERNIQKIATCMRSGGIQNLEIDYIDKEGTVTPVEINAKVIDTPDGIRILTLCRDITDRKRAEKEKEDLLHQLNHSQKMEAIGTLAGGIAHDFNNILAVIIGSADLAIKDIPARGNAHTHIERIEKVAKRAKDLTMNLLTFARKDRLNIRYVSVNEIIIELCDLLKRSISKKIQIKTLFSDEPLMLHVDANQVQQALLNISLNACDAMQANGTLTIECEALDLDERKCGALSLISPGRYCRISVSDTGHGIPDEIREKIFDPFFTTKERGKGTGLGLSISIGIIQGHNGSMAIDSTTGKGTTVSVYLPMSQGIIDPLEASSTDMPAVKFEKGTILVIDDNNEFLETIIDMLKDNGHTAIPANGASKALEIYKKHAPSIDLIILDMMMPEIDGEEAFYILRTMNPDAKVLICSGYSKEGKALRLIESGAIGFLQKPFDGCQLINTVTGALNQS